MGQGKHANDSPLVAEFAQVAPGIYRSGRPDEVALTALASQLKLKTVINLENDDAAVTAEKTLASSLGLTFIEAPIDPWTEPSQDFVNSVLKILADPSRHPVLLHCQHGEDRTGMIVGLYRVTHNGWTAEQAYQEMSEYNFHPILQGLRHYWENATGMELPWF